MHPEAAASHPCGVSADRKACDGLVPPSHRRLAVTHRPPGRVYPKWPEILWKENAQLLYPSVMPRGILLPCLHSRARATEILDAVVAGETTLANKGLRSRTCRGSWSYSWAPVVRSGCGFRGFRSVSRTCHRGETYRRLVLVYDYPWSLHRITNEIQLCSHRSCSPFGQTSRAHRCLICWET